ncbi:inositol polyphosphate-4-phosphatase type I A-like isoform X4 [Apostichopus japonicus]|uniref:inositol polyphosphate-4-phosphatase type I A-like isoform X4 n=1 Tax=Stichopus japonicus TaxID=307972 RepID=UPI003AB8122C
MKFNLKELESLAIQPKEFYTKEGQLYVRTISNSTWRKKPKTDPFSEKWCRLRGNLLFYFKGRDLSSGPQGVIVLEQVVIRPDLGEVQPYAFCVEYIGEPNSQYFAAHSAELRDEWVHVLEKASYDHLRIQLHILRKKLIARTGRDPIAEERHGVLDMGDIMDEPHEEPILEMSMCCSNLPSINSNSAPSTYITVQCVTPPDTWWACVGKTEIVENNFNPHFLTTIVFESRSNISPITRIRASVIQVEDRDAHTIVPLGQAICSIRDIMTSPDNKYRMNFMAADGQRTGGTITLLLWRLEDPDDMGSTIGQESKTDGGPSSPTSLLAPPLSPRLRGGSISSTISRRCQMLSNDSYLKNLFCCPINKTYRIPTAGGETIQVQEIMEETKLSYYIPAEMLSLYKAEETKIVDQLVKLGKMAVEWERAKDAVVEVHFDLKTDYSKVLEYVRKLQSKESQFKKSIDKGEKDLEFVATNLHLQTMQVGMVEGRGKEASYDITTVGAPAAHTMKFKNGGLRRLLHAASESNKGSKSLCQQGQEIIQQVHSTTPEVYQELQDLWDVADGRSVSEMKVKVQAVKEKVDQLLSHLETPVIEQAYCSYYDATRTGSKPERKQSKHTSPQHSKSVKYPERPANIKITRPNTTVWSATRVASVSLNNSSVNRQTSSTSTGSDAISDDTENHNTPLPSIQHNTAFLTLPTLAFVGAGEEVHHILDAGALKTSLIKNLLEKLSTLQHTVDMLPDNAPQRDRCQCINQPIICIKEDLKKLLDQVECAVTFLTLQEEYSHLDTLYSLQKRRDIVFSQAISALIGGAIIQLRRNISNSQFLKQIYDIGLLLHAESLLSTYGDEMGMLEDMAVGINDLEKVSFQIIRGSESDHKPILSGTRNALLVKLPLHPDHYTAVEETVGRECVMYRKIAVKTVLFTVGVNEEQSLAELFGDTSLQEHINQENLVKLEQYYQKFRSKKPASDINVDVPLSSLKHYMQSKKPKNVEILHASTQLSRAMHAIRLTSCKSAKDRTAMSVTLEQCQILLDKHELGQPNFGHLLDTMRSEGTRRDNARKNVGVYKYAFHRMQLKAFPKLYRPPEGTYGKTVAT